MSDQRSASALEADELQQQIVQRGRVFVLWGLFGTLAVGVGVAA